MPSITITPDLIVFVPLALVAALSAIGVVALKNAVRSALCLVLNFFTLSALYFNLRAEIIGITQVVVYTGAIMVLFLFVIMLLNLGAPQLLAEKKDLKIGAGLAGGVILFGVIAGTIFPPLVSVNVIHAPTKYGEPATLGHTLFTQFVWPFEVASILLLVGIVGSILLAKRKI